MLLGFIGLGIMGYSFAGHLSKKHTIKVYNRTYSKSLKWNQEYSGTITKSIKELAKDCDIIFLCLANDESIKEVMYGENGVFESAKKGMILVDHSTTSSNLALELSKACLDKGYDFIDAPVSGGEEGAKNGSVIAMCGGNQKTFNKVKPYIENYTKKIELLGTYGSGQKTKMINQICIAGIIQGLHEAFLLAKENNLDIQQVTDLLQYGGANSWHLKHRFPTMEKEKFDFGFSIDLFKKDLKICLEEANQYGFDFDCLQQAYNLCKEASKNSIGHLDTSALVKLIKKNSA